MYSLGPWPLKILMFALLVTREIATPGAGHAFPRQRHMHKGGAYLFLPGFSSLYNAIHEWKTGQMDGQVT
jgi:hypothetical protein